LNTHSQIMCLHDGDAFEMRDQTSGYSNPQQWLIDWAHGGARNDSGVAVNGFSALTNCALWQGINIIAGDIGQVPFKLMRDDFNEQPDHPASRILNIKPNELQTPSVFKETLMQWALLWGNFVGWIIRDGIQPAAVVPLRPDCVWPEVVVFNGTQLVVYHYNSPYSGTSYTFLSDDVIHVQGLTSDGIWGYPLYIIGANTIGHGLALEKHGNRQFSNGARPSGVLKHPGKMSPEARANLRSEWNAIHQGPDKSGAIAILWEQMDFQETQMSNIDAQWIEASKESAICIARLLNIPAYRLNVIDASSNRANLEEQNENYKQTTLTRHTNRINEEFCKKLLTRVQWLSGRWRLVPQFDTFLGPDIETKSNIATQLVINTIWNPNEARAFMGYPPRADGETYGNPAINPNEPSGESAAEPDEPTEIDELETENAHRALLLDIIHHVMEVEAKRLRTAVKNTQKFHDWLNEFYVGENSRFIDMAHSIAQPSIKACETAGLGVPGWKKTISRYASTRFEAIRDITTKGTAADMPDAIDKLIASTNGEVSARLLNSALGAEIWD
jgi:HK97 family phage portal protein